MTTITQFKIRKPDDFHVHLREGDMLANVLPHTAKDFARALVMPNLKHAICSGVQAREYKHAIKRLSEQTGFEPLMTIKMTQTTSPKTIEDARHFGAIAVKVYPEGVTTNSSNGVRDIEQLDPEVFEAMADNSLVLCVHAEEPGVFSMDREQGYLAHVRKIADEHPRLKIVVEHITTGVALDFVRQAGPNVAATITVHHLLITLDDVVGDKLNPHNFCKPIAKRPEDRSTLQAAALSGDPKFFLGTDSAPHAKDTKECSSGCAGCFTAPIAMPLLAELFDSKGKLSVLERFTSENGAKFYGLPLNKDHMTLERVEGTVPAQYGGWAGSVPDMTLVGVVPFMAGQKLAWRVASG